MTDLLAALKGITVYRNILEEPVMKQVRALLEGLSAGDGEAMLEGYTGLFYHLASEGCSGLGDWLWDYLRYGQSPYPEALSHGRADAVLTDAARRDVETLTTLANMDCQGLIAAMKAYLPAPVHPVLEGLPVWNQGGWFTFPELTDHYLEHGWGLFARYRAFLWQGDTLIPVADPDCMEQAALVGYRWQREEVLANTRALLEGRRVNNVLLYGDSGTGKSATVKSLLTVADFSALRLIEVDQQGLSQLPRLLRLLAGQRQKFILFLDDLTFDKDDRTYSALKTILEGGLEKRPANVAIYATSNRRNLVRQTFSDREGDEVDLKETIQERTSLAERFGLRIPYLTLSKPEFLALVEELAALEGIALPRETLRAQAIQWEMHHPGRTPRTARQFMLSLGR